MKELSGREQVVRDMVDALVRRGSPARETAHYLHLLIDGIFLRIKKQLGLSEAAGDVLKLQLSVLVSAACVERLREQGGVQSGGSVTASVDGTRCALGEAMEGT